MGVSAGAKTHHLSLREIVNSYAHIVLFLMTWTYRLKAKTSNGFDSGPFKLYLCFSVSTFLTALFKLGLEMTWFLCLNQLKG